MGDPGLILDDFVDLTIGQTEVEYLSSTSSCNGSTAPLPAIPEPPAAEIAAIITRLCNTLKVVSAPICPTHPELFMCSCPDAVATYSPSMLSKLKRKTFCRLFDAELLRFTPHGFDFDGTQTAHHLFVYRTRTTPKHWLREWLQNSIASTLFAPQGKQKDTIAALLDYWVMRTTQWRARYGSQCAASESIWFETEYDITYPSVKEPPLSNTHALDRGTLLDCDECLVLKITFSLTTGGLAMTYPTHSAALSSAAKEFIALNSEPIPPDSSNNSNKSKTNKRGKANTAHTETSEETTALIPHEIHIEVSPMSALAKGFGVRYHVWDACHADCEVMSARRQQWVANWVGAELAKRLGYADCWSGKGVAQEEVGGPWGKVRI